MTLSELYLQQIILDMEKTAICVPVEIGHLKELLINTDSYRCLELIISEKDQPAEDIVILFIFILIGKLSNLDGLTYEMFIETLFKSFVTNLITNIQELNLISTKSPIDLIVGKRGI